MDTVTKGIRTITPVQYQALQYLVEIPTPTELLDFEIETLVAKGLASYEHTDSFRRDPPSGLFLLVPPRPQPLDFNHLMSLVEVDGERGVNSLDPKLLVDEIEIPAGSYLMKDVEDGASRRNIRPSLSRQNILNEGRSPYVTFEGIIHVILFPDVLKHHFIDLVGSRCGSGGVPRLLLWGGRPGLDAHWARPAPPGWGSASCGSRVGA